MGYLSGGSGSWLASTGKTTFTTTSEAATGGAVAIKFAGWNGAAYTEGLYIESTSGAAYYPPHISLKNDAYNTNVQLIAHNVNGLQISSVSGNNPLLQVVGWITDYGHTRVTADITNATATMSAITGLGTGISLLAGATYTGRLTLFISNSIAIDGCRFDFDGGTCTATDFRAIGVITDTVSTRQLAMTTLLATDLVDTTTTGSALVKIDFTITVNANGSFLPRFAMESATTGTLTLFRGSHMRLKHTP